MRGILVINAFLNGAKYSEIYSLLKTAFDKVGVELEIKTNAEMTVEIAEKRGFGIENTFSRPDFILFWDKDILLAKHLEMLGFRVFNSAKAIAICDDKGATAVMLENAGIKMPKTLVMPFTYRNIGYPDYSFAHAAAKKLGFPVVVKESKGSFGWQVYLAENDDELENICRKIGVEPFIIEEFIASSKGVDCRVEVIGKKAVAAVKRTAKSGDFRSNVTGGGTMEKFEAPQSFIDMAEKAACVIGLDFAGVDILFGENGEPILCEVNSNAHFKNLLNATGINAADLLAKYIVGVIS